MKDAYTTADMAEIEGVNKRTIQRLAARENWKSRLRPGRGGGKEWVRAGMPDHRRAAIRAHELKISPDFLPQVDLDEVRIRALMQKFTAAPEWSRDRAEARLAVLAAFEKFHVDSGLSQNKAEKSFCRTYTRHPDRLDLDASLYKDGPKKLSPGSLRTWRARYKADGLAGLLSGHGATKGERRSITPDVRVFLVSALTATPHIRPAQLYEKVEGRFNGQTPCERSVYRFMDDWKQDHAALYALMDNPKRWKNKFQAAFGDMSANVTHYGHTWEMDSTPADVMTADGRRCCIIGCIDVYSRRLKLLVAPTSRSVSVAACLRLCLLDWGEVNRLRADNGADYKSKHITAILSGLGVERLWTRPYHGEDKPFIERAFKTYSHGLLELLSGFTGHTVAERAALRERMTWATKIFKPGAVVKAPFTLDELQELTDRWTIKYESTPHRGLNNRTPLEMSKASRRQPRKFSDERTLDILLAPVAERIIGKKGIALDGAVYVSPGLVGHVGKVVEVRRDLMDAGQVYAFEKSTGKLLATALDAALEGKSLEEYLAERRRHFRDLKDQTRAMQTLSRTIDEPYTLTLPTTKIKKHPEKVVKFQAEADTPGLREARKAFETPAPVKGLAQEMGIEPGAAKVIRPAFRAELEPEEPERPVFDKAIDVYDYLTGLEEAQGTLSDEDQEWLDSVTGHPAVQDILRLRAETRFKEKF